MDIVKHLFESGAELLAFDPRFSVVEITGPDALDFLQRMTTNDLVNPTLTSPRMTTFISSQGRVVDHVMVWPREDGEFWLVSLHSSATVLMDWIEQFHFVEDFSVVERRDLKPSFILAHRDHPPAEADGVAKYWSTEATPWEVWLTLNPTNNHLSLPDFTTWRIAALMPAWPSEINDKSMPQAAGLGDYVSLSKGCFIGQEVVSKALTYQKRPKHLAGFKLTSEQHARAQAGVVMVEVQEGREEKAYGLLTSLAPHYAAGEVNALGMTGTGESKPAGEVLVVEENQVFISPR
jgi:folate-binding protein YgfZ